MIERRTHDRTTVGELLDGARPTGRTPSGSASALHQGDLGWHLRLEDAAIQDDAFVGWWDDDTLLAVGLLEGVLGRFTVRPGHDRDPDLGEQVAQVCRDLPADSEVYVDLRPETATRRILAGEGWTLDPEPWVALHADLDRWQPAVDLDRCAGRRGGRRGARPGGRAAIRLRGVDVHRGGLGADGRRSRLPARPRPGARRRRRPGRDRHRVVGRRGRDRHPRARGHPPRPSRPRLGRPGGHRPGHAPARPRRLRESRCARRSTTSARSRPTAPPGCTRSSTSGRWSVSPRA